MPLAPSARTPALLAAAALALLAAAPAPAQQAPAACAGLATGSLEAALRGCARPLADPDLPAPETLGDLVLAQAPAPAEDLVAIFSEWYRRHPIGSTVAPSQARLLDAASIPAGLDALPPGQRYAEFDGMIVVIDPDWKLVRLVRRAPEPAPAPAPTPAPAPAPAPAPTAQAPTPGATAEAEANATANVTINITGAAEAEEDEDDARAPSEAITIAEAEERGIRIPRGHRPPPGSCRIWFPGRPPGRQPAPGPCGVDVPEGAVLIRG